MQMNVEQLLEASRESILEEALSDLTHSHVAHYEKAGVAFTRERLANLLELVVQAIRTRSLASLSEYAEHIARDRFDAGFDVSEVQMAFNTLEEAMWRRVVSDEPADDLVEAIGLLTTVFGFGKDAVARTYVSLASHRHVPSLDLRALFSGTDTTIEESAEG
jgi:hypothetical protein